MADGRVGGCTCFVLKRGIDTSQVLSREKERPETGERNKEKLRKAPEWWERWRDGMQGIGWGGPGLSTERGECPN